MAERADDTTIQLIVAAAIAASGPNAPYPKVMQLIPQVAAWMTDDFKGGPSALARQVAEAENYTGVLKEVVLEESSKRHIVRTVKRDGEIEEIRTNPYYTPHGKAIADALKAVEPGTEVLIWKAIETTDDPNKKVRVAVHFKTLRSKDAVAGQGPTRPQRTEAGSAPQEEPSPPVAPPASNLDPRRQAIRDNIRASSNPSETASLLRERWGSVDLVPEDKLELALYMSLNNGEEPF